MSETTGGAPPTPSEEPVAAPAAAEDDAGGPGTEPPRKKRGRGSRGGPNRNRPRDPSASAADGTQGAEALPDPARMPDDLPERISENRPKDAEVAERALVRKPQI